MFRELEQVKRAARRAKGRVLVGHVRWASNPLKLPKQRLIGPLHTQPFAFRRWIFAHNGTLLIPKEVRAQLGLFSKHVRGHNDSEVLFYWLMKHLEGRRGVRPDGRHIVEAIRKSLRGIEAIWDTCREKYPLYKFPYHGLNWVLTNGKTLVAMAYVNPGGFGKAKALCCHSEPYYQLYMKRSPDGWMVASEPLDADPRWRPVPHGSIVVAGARGGKFWRL
jgi:predicted glutamine amidotransferase